ncbi:hypothetical protein BDV96DRAFT_595004 [Lophiotrema nucula]|uniref:Uncharacterized protein n=1 Tax=Lophiotrema nucula TaxID=690887 RepID=A0A6A5ZN06_9PLEO|nr:hypothetical protein BDV96DRAFT_595004 [Lophiotrema nucula]
MGAWGSLKSKEDTSSRDDGTLSNVSQGLNGMLGVICILVPLIQRNKDLQPELPVQNPGVFRWLLTTSTITAVLSMIIGPFQNGVGMLCGFASSATQLAATLQLIVGSSETITNSQREISGLDGQMRLLSLQILEERKRAFAARNEPQ